MIDLPAVDYGFEPRALLCGALDGHQQREEAFAVPCAGILLHRPTERRMLRLGLGGKPCRVSRQESERGFFVLPIFREVEMNSPDQVPCRMTGLEKRLHGER